MIKRLVWLVLLIYIGTFVNAQDTIVPPAFPGGNEVLNSYINQQLEGFYRMKNAPCQGLIRVSFVVNKNGEIRTPEVINSLGETCDSIALSIANSMPPWNPGRVNGEPVEMDAGISICLGKLKKNAQTMDLGADSLSRPEEVVYLYADRSPVFDGSLGAYIIENLHYADEAKENMIQGRVTVRFVVGKEGRPTEVEVLMGVHSLLDEQAVKLFQNSPPWIPGVLNGEAVPVVVIVPIIFSLPN